MDRIQIDNINGTEAMYRRNIAKHMANGVIFKSLDGVRISDDCVIGRGTVIDRDNDILGNTVIGECVQINVGNIIESAEIGSNTTLLRSVVRHSRIGANSTVGPYAHVHSHSTISRDCRIGNYVEIKNSHIGINTKMAHLAYIGDTDIGNKCNIGCGAIFVNYDGKNKHRSRIGNSVFVGSNSNIIAPVSIDDNAYIAAGTTVTVDLPAGSMCIGRKREIIKENRSKYRMGDYNKKYFGTDGIRGVYGENLTDDMAYLVGNYLGYSADNGRIVVGRDTRPSGKRLLDSMVKGITDAGSSAIVLDITSTPSVAYITATQEANYGVMLTASHNPPEYNGIKIFNNKGVKLTNIEEVEIEEHIDKNCPYIRREKGNVQPADNYITAYIAFLTDIVTSLGDIKVVLDCANGGISEIARRVMDKIGARYTIINSSTDGRKINSECGALYPKTCAQAVIESVADIGFSFDGDADRVLAIDKSGKVIDGDMILYVIAQYLHQRGELNGDTVVGTVMTNGGVKNSLDKLGIKLVRTAVGDHYVADCMIKNGYLVGGEQSGHIILREYENTGDGLLVALYLCKIILETGCDLATLASCDIYPQHNINILTTAKKDIASDPTVRELITEQSALLDGGRIVLRESGTEPKLRITAECRDISKAESVCKRIESYIRSKYPSS